MYNQAPDKTLYLARIDQITYRASINESWSSAVNLIRVGYKLITDDGGYGVVIRVEPTNIYLQVTSPYPQITYAPGTWKLYVPTITDIQKFLPELLDGTKLIPELMTALQNQIDEVDDSVLRLNYSKDYDNTSNELLSRTLSDIGIEFYEEVSMEVLRRLVQESVAYNLTSGRRKSLDYIGISLGVDLNYEQLWTSDYKSFFTYEELPLANRDQYYPTNYVRVTYDDLGSNIKESVIVDMFYQLAWICNVIYDIVYAIKIQNEPTVFNSGLLTHSFIPFENADAEMEQRLKDTYIDTMPMPPLVTVSTI